MAERDRKDKLYPNSLTRSHLQLLPVIRYASEERPSHPPAKDWPVYVSIEGLRRFDGWATPLYSPRQQCSILARIAFHSHSGALPEGECLAPSTSADVCVCMASSKT
jgi:hypothetical protein